MTPANDEIGQLDGVELVRSRPLVFLPGATRGTERLSLVERTLRALLLDDERQPRGVEVTQFRDAVSILDDGQPLPVETVSVDGVAHPLLYLGVLTFHGGEGLLGWAPVLNALCQRLLFETADGERVHRATFSRGGVVQLLHESRRTHGLRYGVRTTFCPDQALFPRSPLDALAMERLITRLGEQHPNAAVRFEDRSDRRCPWL